MNGNNKNGNNKNGNNLDKSLDKLDKFLSLNHKHTIDFNINCDNLSLEERGRMIDRALEEEDSLFREFLEEFDPDLFIHEEQEQEE